MAHRPKAPSREETWERLSEQPQTTWIKVIPKNATSQRDEKRFLVRLPKDTKDEDVDTVKKDLGDRFAPKFGPIRNIYTSQRGTKVSSINQLAKDRQYVIGTSFRRPNLIDDKIKEDERERKRKRSKSKGRVENANRISLMDRSDMEARRIRDMREQEKHPQAVPRQAGGGSGGDDKWGDGPDLTRAQPKRRPGKMPTFDLGPSNRNTLPKINTPPNRGRARQRQRGLKSPVRDSNSLSPNRRASSGGRSRSRSPARSGSAESAGARLRRGGAPRGATGASIQNGRRFRQERASSLREESEEEDEEEEEESDDSSRASSRGGRTRGNSRSRFGGSRNQTPGPTRGNSRNRFGGTRSPSPPSRATGRGNSNRGRSGSTPRGRNASRSRRSSGSRSETPDSGRSSPRSPDAIARGLFGGRSTRGGTADSGRSDTPESRGGRFRGGSRRQSDDSDEDSPRNGRRRNSTPASPTRTARRARGFGVRSASPDETFVGGRQRRRTVGGVGAGGRAQSGRGPTRRAYQSGGSAGSDYRGGSADSEDVIDRSESSTASSSSRRSHFRSRNAAAAKGEKVRVASAGAGNKNKALPAIYKSRGSAGSDRKAEVNLDKDDSGRYRARNAALDTASMILDTSRTRIDLPVDLKEAREVDEEELERSMRRARIRV